MENAFNYYEKTKNTFPRKNVRKFINMNVEPGNCIDLGCGAGNDTIFLIKNGWKVTAIDKEDTENIIRNYLSKKEQENLKFKKEDFKNLILNSCNLLIANFSLFFCEKENFNTLWNKIVNSILDNGYFVGNFLGVNDSWANKPNMTFFTKDDILKLFSGFEIIDFSEVEKKQKTALGQDKHWHIINVIAIKNNIYKGETNE